MAGENETKAKCRYGDKCYRKDADHLKMFSHPKSGNIPDISLDGKNIVLAGKMKGGSRQEMEAKARLYGCVICPAVSRKTDLVVIGDGVKEDVCKAYGVQTVTESDWDTLLKKSPQTHKPPPGAAAAGAGDSDTDVEMEDTSSKTTSNKRKLPKVHSISDSESESTVPAKSPKIDKGSKSAEAKDSEAKDTKAAARPTLKRQNTRGKKQKCIYWDKCYRREAAHREMYRHPGDAEEVTAKNTMLDGDEVTITSGGTKYTMKRTGDIYECSCREWRNHSAEDHLRTCKHLTQWLGEEYDRQRVRTSAATGEDDDDEEMPAKPKVYRPKHKNIGQLLLAHKWTEETNPTGWWLSEKLDGVRAFWDGRTFYSRLGNEFIAPAWFTKGLPSDMELDGELFGGRGKFQSTVSIVKTPESPNWKSIMYKVFDAPSVGQLPFEKRIATIKEFFDKNKLKYSCYLEQEKCRGVTHLKEELKRIEDMGGEGVMLREPRSKYVHGRSKMLLKLKSFHDAEAVVVGYEPSKSNPGITGSLRCRMACGKFFNVGSGLTDKDRRQPPKKGSIITYRFQEYTNSGSPRFPTYVGVRIDATEPKDVVLAKKGD